MVALPHLYPSLGTTPPTPGLREEAACLRECVCASMRACVPRVAYLAGAPREACPRSVAGHVEWAVCSARSWSRGPRRMLAWKRTSGATGLQTAMALPLLRAGLHPPSPISPTTTTSPLSPPAPPSSTGAPAGASQVSPMGWSQALTGPWQDLGEGETWTFP